ncbi:unnamed protein product [Cyprideis torosa]|uniref:Uncharacterized protein n=1 Tax=Cyprideis torosa TaxID=163714 RepID=A0A7R8WN40_9CRUS|nr:unnamed protein product [Cyprideis torosa]CAG0905776.1 unnamed protein product [Cyprideis torosa]
MGANEVGDTNTFKWASTGQMLDFFEWAPGEPNGSGKEDAIYLHCWDWVDAHYDFYSPHSICEAPPLKGQSSGSHQNISTDDM